MELEPDDRWLEQVEWNALLAEEHDFQNSLRHWERSESLRAREWIAEGLKLGFFRPFPSAYPAGYITARLYKAFDL